MFSIFNSKKKKILIVDDEEYICDLIKILLEERDGPKYNIVIETDGKTAQDLVRQKDFDLYVLDIMLCGTTGIELAEIIRKKSDNPIIFITGYPVSDHARESLKSSLTEFVLIKPFCTYELTTLIDKLIDV